MFTGLVEGRGAVSQLTAQGAGVELSILPPREMLHSDPNRIGDSVAINGCCLTIVRIDELGWTFQAGPETLAKTNLGRLQRDRFVNLERAMPVTGRLGGHFVQGHVDGVGELRSVEQTGEWTTLKFGVPRPLTRQMVPKGSMTVDGVSLTLVTVSADEFTVALIPHTLQVTSLGTLQLGDTVNIETDILGKYVEKLLGESAL